MADDPVGYYARLEVEPTASSEAIAAAYRRKARVLHPDVAGTGDAAAFIQVKQAYDVLSDPHRRAAYDRGAAPPAPPAVEEPKPRGPRLSDLPVAVWAGFGGLLCLAVVMAVVQFSRSPPPPQRPPVRAFAPSAPAAPRPQVATPAGIPASGPTTHYVLPTSGDTTLWRHDPTRDGYLPGGHIAAFSPVRAVRMVPQHGLVEIALADGGSGFIDAARLAAGDRPVARRAYCAYSAGPAPRTGEMLNRQGTGPARLEISNRGQQSAVVKLRDASGRAVATVFVRAGERTVLADLPYGAYRPEFATGELWSSACNDFATGLRAQRFAYFASPAGLSPLVIPPGLSAAPAPVDIPDEVFEHE